MEATVVLLRLEPHIGIAIVAVSTAVTMACLKYWWWK